MNSETTSPSAANSSESASPIRDVLEVGLVLLIAALGVLGAQRLGPTTAAGNAAAFAGILGTLAVALVVPKLRGEPFSVLGFRRPASWRRAALVVVLGTAALAAAGWLALQWILPRLTRTVAPDTSRFGFLDGNLWQLAGTLLVMWISAAFAEEVVYRGFLMGRLARLLGKGRGAWLGALAISTLLFGLLHIYQGVSGVVVTGLAGCVLGCVYLAAGRSLWVAIVVHGLTNSISLTALTLAAG